MALPRSPFDWSKTDPHHGNTYSRFSSRRSTVLSTRGMVASSQPLASSAGIEILNAGGNAADAAVAVAAALNVTEPCNTGIGGDAFCLFYSAENRKVRAFNGSGRAPKAMTLDVLRSKGVQGVEIPMDSLHAVTVPGAPAAWVDTVEKLGSGKLTLHEILAPAIRLAEQGYPVHESTAFLWGRSEALIKRMSQNSAEMLYEGRAPRTGEIMRMPTLARTFRELATKGKEGFYTGRVAQAIVDLVQSQGGVLEMEDLKDHLDRGTEEVTPIQYTYNHPAKAGDLKGKEGVTMYECPPNGQGLTTLVALGILDELQNQGLVGDLAKMVHNSVEYLHALIEALRLAFADTRYHVSDPAHSEQDVAELLLNQKYLAGRAKLFDAKTASVDLERGSPTNTCDTVYFSVTDSEGNACSLINSNYAGFGTGAVPAGCGFTLQNRGAGFTLEEGHPNNVAPRKRPYHTIIPAMATRGDELFLSFGVMGGFMQPQGQVQVLMNVLHHGFSIQDALDAPRFCIGAGMAGPEGAISEVYFEEGVDENVVKGLEKMGHKVKVVGGWGRFQFGRGQVIQKVETKDGRLVWAAGSDPRADGQAIAQV
ncbi:related to lincomycin-condensing protein lmbA [Melanopsichium pennsylvanicum]|uniref:Related to lincomycin-condensing protein lmbA n=2 Tax=Melanopsichium pennsylvanicum TaxID=63383 RepID=A0AAJ4XNC7_9BASI|nr:related to lincomycin-condensing protein lmbA [Melanopsichium pennsylvanicum 4]SNX85435.1 related to lincomycin-condensing protein lmbA [Melanopsichium pennsylvanicum]